MNFLADENVDSQIVKGLRKEGYSVTVPSSFLANNTYSSFTTRLVFAFSELAPPVFTAFGAIDCSITHTVTAFIAESIMPCENVPPESSEPNSFGNSFVNY